MTRFLIFALLAATVVPSAAIASAWGTLTVAAEREWTTEKEPRARVTKYRWVEPDRVLEARHGFVSRLQFGEAKFADTIQRFVRDPKTGVINVSYTYEDGRAPLKTVIKVESDGSLVETFTDAKGVKKRNTYKTPSPALNVIERQEMKGSAWVSLGITRKAGLTQIEIAENKRRAEEAQRLAIAQENSRRAAREAQRQAALAQQQAYEQQQSDYAQEEPPMQQGMNMLDVLNGMASSINQQNQQQQSQFERQMRSNSSSGGSGGGSIIVDNSPAPTYTSPSPSYTPPAPPPPPTYSSTPSVDTCKRRVPYNYGVYKDLPYKEGTRCLDAAKVSGQ